MTYSLLTVTILFALCICIRSENSHESYLKVVDALLDTNKYDKRISPTANKGITTEVMCSLGIRSFWSLSHQTMDFQVDMYLRLAWNDHRMNHINLTQPMILNNEETIYKFWRPEIYFPNARSGDFQKLMVPNHVLWLYPKNETNVVHITRFIMKFSCLMNLRKYPLDKQKCVIEISTLGREEGIDLKWLMTEPIVRHSKVRLPNFRIVEVMAGSCDEHYKLGNYSCLEAEFHLERLLGYHIVQNFIPTILIVVISWVSFWMDVEVVPGRVTLGITTLLTVTSKATGVQANLPEVSYVKAIDIWMGICTTFVFAALFEFVLAHYMCRQYKLSFQQKSTDLCTDSEAQKKKLSKPLYLRVDEAARIIFPTSFFIFCLIYWISYLYLSDDVE